MEPSRRASSLLLFTLLQLMLIACFHCQDVPFACDTTNSSVSSLPFCNKSLPIAKRVADLIGRLTLEEKVQQLITHAAGVPRLGIPRYEWGSEALHGVSDIGSATHFGGNVPAAVSFPQVILTAASFNATLWKTIAKAISTEARAMYNAGNAGLTFWSPVVNIFRDPRWGRGQETPGEDPTLTSNYATNFVRGLQDTDNGDPSRLKVAACCKHHAAYDLESWNGIDRLHFDAQVTKQDLNDTYEPPFKTCIQDANVACVMCAYNKVNGVPACINPSVLVQSLRDRWGMNGYIVSDCDALQVLYEDMHYTKTPEDAAVDALLAGLDLNCGYYLANYSLQAIQGGRVNESVADHALSNSYAVLMRLGFFDGNPTNGEYGFLGPADVCTEDHRKLAVEAARQSIVLLKNEENMLPLPKGKLNSLAVIGPNANVTETMIGNYHGVPCNYTTPLQGLQRYSKTLYQIGCLNVSCSDDSRIAAAARTAAKADAVVLIVGLDQTQEREGFDRTDLVLPGHQQHLVLEVASAAKEPVVLVVMSGGPVDISFAKNSSKIGSILWVGYPGEAGGEAVAEIIFGDHNPAGRLPITWYPQSFTKVPMTDMAMRPNASRGYPGRTYRFYTGEMVYSFGYGLSYTNFFNRFSAAQGEHHVVELQPGMAKKFSAEISINSLHGSMLEISDSAFAVKVEDVKCESLSLDVVVEVENGGTRDGAQVVLLFSSPPQAHPGSPKKQLVAFDRVHVTAGAKREVRFKISPCDHLSTANEHGERVLALGAHVLSVNDEQEHLVFVKMMSRSIQAL